MAASTEASSRGGGVGVGQNAPIITSLLDTDLYKLTMLQAVRAHFPTALVSFKFTNRSASSMSFTHAAFVDIQEQIARLAHLRLSSEEALYLKQNCPYFTQHFLHWLQHDFSFRPQEQVKLTFVPSDDDQGRGQISLETHGSWADTILYEVPLMAIISEVYFRTVDTHWDLRSQSSLAAHKAHRLIAAGCVFSDFGTRRRRSFATHKAVIQGLIAGSAQATQGPAPAGQPGKLLGTSNVLLAKIFGLTPIGTMAHEWFMGIGAALGYPHASQAGLNTHLRALQLWDDIYAPPPHGHFTPTSPAHDLTVALTDTFSTAVFWDELLLGDAPGSDLAASASSSSPSLAAAREAGLEIVKRWRAIRQDSGDSKAYAREAVRRYKSAGIDPKTKTIIFSDGLDVDKCIDLLKYSQEIGIGAGFGVGTSFTNDFMRLPNSETPNPHADPNAPLSSENPEAEPRPHAGTQKSKALNMVIKLGSIDGKPTVKISDELSKNTGVKEEVVAVKARFGLEGGST
ncbi:nicotinate phosphoribosyltransferase [Tilletia horrida]|nr:nicotinate phosphoribosyltransferase [Tilletia horrida]